MQAKGLPDSVFMISLAGLPPKRLPLLVCRVNFVVCLSFYFWETLWAVLADVL